MPIVDVSIHYSLCTFIIHQYYIGLIIARYNYYGAQVSMFLSIIANVRSFHSSPLQNAYRVSNKLNSRKTSINR